MLYFNKNFSFELKGGFFFGAIVPKSPFLPEALFLNLSLLAI